jgi:hypothetical protein
MIEYKSGTMTSKVNGDVIHVADVQPQKEHSYRGGGYYCWATEIATNTTRMWDPDKWDFEPDKISVYDLFDSWDVGTKFLWINHNGDRMHRDFKNGDEYYWLKVGKNQMVYTSNYGPVVVQIGWGDAAPILSAQNIGDGDTIVAI